MSRTGQTSGQIFPDGSSRALIAEAKFHRGADNNAARETILTRPGKLNKHCSHSVHSREMPTRVLLVEDDILTRRNTALYLRRSQLEVEEAANGEEAVHLITTIDKYDVLVSDLRMPGMTDGMDVISWQRRVSPDTLCILVTAFGSQQLQQQAEALGVVYLEKPITLSHLVTKIADLTARHKP